MRVRQISALVCGASLLGAFALALRVIPNPWFRTVVGDLVPLLVITATMVVTLRNALDSRGHTRFFWGLMTAAMSLWWFNQASWAWYELWLRRPLPEPNVGDVVLYLHMVPMMAALLLRPPEAAAGEPMLLSVLNVLMLMVWWVVVYAFVIFPDQYVVLNVPVYSLNWDILYALEGLMLIGLAGWAFFGSQGPWRVLYRNILVASIVYNLASEAMNGAIAANTYVTGGIWDLPFLAALLGFLWVALSGRQTLAATQEEPSAQPAGVALAPRLAKLALFSLPVMGYWALFLSASPARTRQVRFEVAMGGVAALAFFVFLKQHLLDRRLVRLLTKSRRSYDNLQKLQGRVVQQEKLASLGELVALAASELEYPLAGILESSEQLAASSNLKTEQLAIAQKIGRQARRTRDLVSDLLSFAQQVPGDKAPLELKPLVQRAVQMEGFKLENHGIHLAVESADPLPRVLGNSNQLLQGFLQIIENAVDALQEVGGGRLLISLWREDQHVVIQFADTGPGMRHPERVFDPFYTTKPVGKGTGLGLSATYGVVQDHKGEITCSNRPEGGAAFEIRLPALKTGAAVADAARA
jgi:signal transduction histidine kinase